MMTAAELEAVLRRDYERRDVELKGPGPRGTKHLFAKIAKAALSMGNLRDGGYVVIGINDDQQAQMLPGLNDAELASWMSYDKVAAALAEYCDPPLRMEISKLALSSGATVAILRVEEFEDVPHLCIRDFGDMKNAVTKKGALYVRSRKSPATTEIALSSELRDIITLATEKALRAYVRTAERAGFSLADLQADADRYKERLASAWSRSTLADMIQTKGHWSIHIRPELFALDRVPYRQLEPILQNATVRLLGWPMPFIETGTKLLRGNDWIGTDINDEPVNCYETWRFLTTGEFAQLESITTDWGRTFVGSEIPDGFTSIITVWQVVALMTETHELAARLALSAAGADPMRVEIRLNALDGRALVPGLPGRAFMLPFRAPEGESVNYVATYSRDDLVAAPQVLAVSACEEFFARFGWQPQRWEIEAQQNQIQRG